MKQDRHIKWIKLKKRLRKKRRLKKKRISSHLKKTHGITSQNSTIIRKLLRLDLSQKPIEAIRTELGKILTLPFMTTTIHPNKEIERAVPNTEKEPIFSTVSRLSYKPKEYNTDYQRASTPDNTMFYGSVITADLSEEEICNARIIGAAESCDLIRDEAKEDGEKLITFGKWRIKEPLDLVTIVNPNKQYKVKYLNELVNAYKVRLSKIPTDDSYEIQVILTYISDEFSKKVNQGENYNYMVSAILTEMLVTHKNNKTDGILYPSVQTDGFGLCVAVRPEAMHKLELIKVLQCNAVRKGKEVTLENVNFCEVNPPNTDFKLQPIN